MKIVICGSMSAVKEMQDVKEHLTSKGFSVTIPQIPKYRDLIGRNKVSPNERTKDKIKFDLIRGYYKKIKGSDIVLVVNPEKNGIKGYIGGNTFVEMAFAHVLDKKLFCLYQIPKMAYTSEILAFRPIILNGNLEKPGKIK